MHAGWNRLRDIAQEIAVDPRLVTQLGRLFYKKQITSLQFEAGSRWSQYLHDYDRIKHGRTRTPASPSFEVRSPGEPSSVLTDKDQFFLERFGKAHSALLAGGMMVEGATHRLCRDEGVGAYFVEAIRGLDLLVEHYSLTSKPKRAR